MQRHLVHHQIQTLRQLIHLGDGKSARLPGATMSPINLSPGQTSKGKTEKRSIFGFSSDPFSSIHLYVQFVKGGGRKDVVEKSQVI